MGVPHPLPYQGSKRGIARQILTFVPRGTKRLVEPFAGSAAVSLAAAHLGKIPAFLLNDVNAPLMALWDLIVNRPADIIAQYTQLWQAQRGRYRKYYDEVRDKFNRTQRPDLLLYLLARCVKASVRYNGDGHFNQSPDNRRKGASPAKMAWHIRGASQLLLGKTELSCDDYKALLTRVAEGDLLYLDPPYQGVSRNRDPRYLTGVDFAEFTEFLEALNRKRTPFILSYDGRTGEKVYGRPIPEELGLHKIEVDAGRSSQATLLGRSDRTYESVYLSPVLHERCSPGLSRRGELVQAQFELSGVG
jgi:DNA adenine methylase